MTSTNAPVDPPETVADAPAAREKVRFASGATTCAAWHYPGTNGGCVVMAAGLAVTKEPGTDRIAARLNEAGFAVLAFDYRHLGESGGQPRQIADFGRQREDLHAAIAFARTLAGVDPARVAVWGFSSSGGHVFPVAARDPELAAAIAHAPLADGPAAFPNALRHQAPTAALRFFGRAIRDAVGLRLGREPLLIPLAGPRGTVTSLTTPDAQTGAGALDPGGRHPEWRQEVAASSALHTGLYRPGRAASRVACPLLVLVYDDDGVAVPHAAVAAGERAPRGEVAHLPGGHYAAFLDQHEPTIEILVGFLERHLLDRPPVPGR
ncbi:MAG: alpha/beta hydrolase [Conexibacter sp.]|nr:alpha/beta hydrolase [Conexibacter sp.]